MSKKIKTIKPVRGGGVILAFDFSSLEVMVFTNLAHETELGKIVQAGLDMHSAVAQKIFPELKDVPLKQIKTEHKKLRQYAKSATFGTLYGSSEYNLSQQLDIPVEQAKNIIDGLLDGFPGLRTYIDTCHSFAKKHGYIDTEFGYRRQLDSVVMKYPDLKTAKDAGMGLRYKHALNASQNHCFVEGTLVVATGYTEGVEVDKYIPIEQITEKDLIYGYDEQRQALVMHKAKVIDQGVQTTIQLVLDTDEVIECTPDHKFFLEGQWIEAKDLLNKPITTLHNTVYHDWEHKTYVKSIKNGSQKHVYDLTVVDDHNPNFFVIDENTPVLVHNCVQSTASIVGWICATHIQDEILKQGLYSRVIGNVHDSVEIDVYPGEVQDIMRIINYHAKEIPNNIYPWMDLVQLRFDYELGESWSGTAGECKVDFNEDGTTTVHWGGGDLWWDYLYKQLSLGYNIEVISKEEVRDYEKDNDCPLAQPEKEIEVVFKILNPTSIKEFKSKYYVGNGALNSKIPVEDLS